MSTIADLRLKQDGLLQDDDGILATEEKDVFIRHGVMIYSRAKPREKALDIAGTGGYEFALPTDWVEEFSAPRSIEYPLGDQKPPFIPIEEVVLYRTPTGLKLRFTRDTLAVGKTARLLYTVPHTVSDTTSTVPATDEDAVAAAAAGLACEALANHYAKTTDSTIGADAVTYRTKSQEYAARAKRLLALFRESLGLTDDGGVAPASGVRDWGTTYQWGEDRLLHPKDRR